MSAIDLLSRFLNAYKFSIPLEPVMCDPDLKVLSGLGLVETRFSGATVLCDACDLMHDARIAIDPITDKLGWRCPEAGFVEASSDQQKTVRFSPEKLATEISGALQSKQRRKTVMIEGLLWSVGYFDFQGHDVNVFLASRIQDSEDTSAIAGALMAEPSLRNGLVITPNISGIAGLTIAGCRFAEIGDLIDIDGNKLCCNQSRVAALAGITVKRRAGRPQHSYTNQAIDLIRKRYSEGTYEHGKRAEAREIMRQLGDNSPKKTKLYEIISSVWSAH